ncbi:hypothetical protein [Polycladidibacter stylochi]|uniref:hypothetical protein n=1 Tax=Polycladidibacter stylochi TaxID=1807766 RepID=UPI0008336F4C|nr:hypothetical protein [Pseudovibrio stylochi]
MFNKIAIILAGLLMSACASGVYKPEKAPDLEEEKKAFTALSQGKAVAMLYLSMKRKQCAYGYMQAVNLRTNENVNIKYDLIYLKPGTYYVHYAKCGDEYVNFGSYGTTEANAALKKSAPTFTVKKNEIVNLGSVNLLRVKGKYLLSDDRVLPLGIGSSPERIAHLKKYYPNVMKKSVTRTVKSEAANKIISLIAQALADKAKKESLRAK